MFRVCDECKFEQDESQFKTKSLCLVCFRERDSDSRKEARALNRRKLYAYLITHPCVDCGETNPICLDFDHVRGVKSANISDMIGNRNSWSTIANEIAKCDVRCKNCHAKRTAIQFGWYKSIDITEFENEEGFNLGEE